MIKAHQKHTLWFAFLMHRISGLGLALFLPAHFYLLSLALKQPERMDTYLSWAENPLVKLAEFGLVFLLAVHLFGGLRLMAFESLSWTASQKTAAACTVAAAFAVSTAFLLRAI
ncbi:MAG: fumarate reductase subunit D [Granulosicoccus sp.]|jgi:fumarate reductase subunit D